MVLGCHGNIHHLHVHQSNCELVCDNLFQELLKTSVDIGDLLGIHLVMSRVAARGDVKVRIGIIATGVIAVITMTLGQAAGLRFCFVQNSIFSYPIDVTMCYSNGYHISMFIRSNLFDCHVVPAAFLAFSLHGLYSLFLLASFTGYVRISLKGGSGD